MKMKITDNGTDRDMTKDEETAYLANAKIATTEAKTAADALEARQAARQAVLNKLGLTADEAAALLG